MDAFLEQGAGSQGQIFTANPVTLEHGLRSGQRRLNTLAAGSGSVLAAFQGGEVARWFPDEDEFTLIESKDRVGEVSRVLLDPTGFHALMTNSGGETWYLNFDCTAATRLPKLKGHVLESASWDVEATFGSTKDLLLGTRTGQILHVVIEFANGVGKEKTVKTAFEFERVPVVGVHRERVFSGDGLERLVLFACAGAFLHAFVGTSLESLLQRYAGEKVGHRTRVFEVPYDSPYGDLQVDDACVGEPGTKVLFWLTGVGVVAAKVQATVGEDSAGCVESPPGLVRFPGGKAQGNSVSPPPLPKVPRSMALTRFHLIFAFEDRWVAVSRITHEVVQQQDWASSTYGPLRSLANDVHGHRLWICSERHAFELVAEKEDRNVWALLLRLEQFDDALAACQRPSERMRVLAAHADWLFRKGPDMELEAARKFAQATAVPFEHVALRFLHRKAALLEYLRCRLRRAEDQVTRALLSVWAVEISLAQLNEHPDRSSDTHAELQKELVELLRQCSDLDVHATIYHLLQSHGWLDELAMFAEMRKDYTTVILHHVSRRDCAAAIRKLENMKSADGQELVCRFAPVLFGAEPKAFASLLLRPQLETLDPLLVLPGIFALHSRTHRSEATRYLEHAVRHERTEKSSGRTLRSGSLLLDNNLGCVEEGQRYGWAVGGQAILNALVLLYAEPMEGEGSEAREGEGSEAGILRFLAAQEGNPLLDLHFALRVCRRQGLIKAVVMLYGLMAMHEEAVEVALEHQDVALAKHSACRPQEKRLRQKLWLRIVEHQAASSDVQKIIGLIRESQELTVRDVLPYLPDTMTIDAFKAEICECLDTYEGQIVTLRREMEDHRSALQAFKEDLKQAEERCITVARDQSCELCGLAALKERFYAFACSHCCHEACLRALVLPSLPAERRQRLLKLEAARLQHQAAASFGQPKEKAQNQQQALAEVEDELDSILAEDCPLCGQLMIDCIMKPFIDPEEEDIESWAIPD